MLPAVNVLNILTVEEEERLEVIRVENLERRLMRDESNPFAIENVRFKELFRLNKDMAQYVFNRIGPNLIHTNNPVAIPNILNFFGVLRFYATGAYQRVIGRGFEISMSQQSMSRAVHEVTMAIVNTFAGEWIRFPITEESKNEIRGGFMQLFHFPGVIGVVDCTHIEIRRPVIEEHNYLNRKGFYSKNVQRICDHTLKILNINARYAGATHDRFIWRNSAVRAELEGEYQRGNRNNWLLGDSGYPQEPWLMTPIENALPNTPQYRYTQHHKSARNCIERCIGILKERFLCLSKILRYTPEKVGQIVNACAILHNICINGNLDIDFELQIHPPEEHPYQNQNNYVADNLVRRDGLNIRQNIINRYFM